MWATEAPRGARVAPGNVVVVGNGIDQPRELGVCAGNRAGSQGPGITGYGMPEHMICPISCMGIRDNLI